jgi:glycosyltransferase involved in cell wall biosynthesis
VPADRVGVVPNAIDPQRFKPLPDAGAAHRRRLGIPADAFLIGCLTRFNVRKRNEVAIDAAVRLAAQPGRAVHLLMIGEGDAEAAQRNRAAPLGDAAHFVPTTGAEPAELLSGCDVVVFCPSPTEGEPLAISMGMLTERPVVATAAEGATGLATGPTLRWSAPRAERPAPLLRGGMILARWPSSRRRCSSVTPAKRAARPAGASPRAGRPLRPRAR